jgi:TolB-like protein/DNA-binding winged helix-turn-helix (wHTH) protein/tetratricopeptide (TPR) repeat protein
MDASAQVFRFGSYESRPRTRELYKNGSKLKVRPQPLQVLNVLLGRAGDVVTREEFRRELWSSETFVDFEHGLNTSVKEIRAVLGDSPSEPRYIETLPKLGYRFIAPVETIEPAAPFTTHAAVPSQDSALPEVPAISPASFPSGGASRHWPAVVGLCAVLLMALGAGTYYLRFRTLARAQPAVTRSMLAVLPFENLTGDAGQDYLSDGLTEEMIAQLGRLDPEHLGVIARTSVMHYKHAQEPLGRIGQELNVQYVLEGSVRRDAGKVRVTTQLIRMSDQAHVWSHEYDRDLSSLLLLQGEIARETTDEIQSILGARRTASSDRAAAPVTPKSYEAYDLYLRGRYFWNKRSIAGFERAVEFFEQALAKDPSYARAHAGLADTYALMASYYVVPQAELIPKARAAALKALDLDEDLAEAHTSLALIAQNYDWDWQTAEKEFRRAIALDPNYATGHHWYAEHLAFRGRFNESFEEMERARQLDPLSLIMQTDSAMGLYFARQYDRAIPQFRVVLDMEPKFERAHSVYSAYAQQGEFTEALNEVRTWDHQKDRNLAWVQAAQAYIYGRAGQPEQAQRCIEELLRIHRSQPLYPIVFVAPYIGSGDKDQAFAWLEKSVAAHSPGLTALKVDPVYDPLRSDPRFQDLLRRVGLAQ